MLIIYNMTWAVIQSAHASFGYRSFNIPITARIILDRFGEFGEGYHNNHHAKPRCAAHGLKWWEFDLTRDLIWVLEKCGLA